MPRRGENIYKRKDGRWEGRYKIGCAETGKTKYRSVYGKTYQEVKNQLTVLKSEKAVYQTTGKLTVKVLFEEWMTAIRSKVKISSYANYRLKIDKHILPEFGNLRYSQLTANHLHQFIQRKLDSGLSPKYVSDIVIVFKSMAKYIAVTHSFQNPIANVILPKAEKKEQRLFSETKQKQLCEYLMLNKNRTSLCTLISLYMGLRIGEICSLRWEDIDFKKRILSVKRTVQRVKGESSKTRLIIDMPKSKSSLRQIPIPKFLLSLLSTFRGNADDYVLSGNSQIIEPRTMQYRFKSLLKKAGLPSINYHSLRHMFATNCIAMGFDVKTLSELVGHSSVEITLNRYVHSSLERKMECMNRLKVAA